MFLCKLGLHSFTGPQAVYADQPWPKFWEGLPESYKDGKAIYRACTGCGRVETSMRFPIKWVYAGLNMDGVQRYVA